MYIESLTATVCFDKSVIQVYGGRHRCGEYLPHIVNCYFVDFTLHTAVSVTALHTKEVAH
jgi:hypothetical protein